MIIKLKNTSCQHSRSATNQPTTIRCDYYGYGQQATHNTADAAAATNAARLRQRPLLLPVPMRLRLRILLLLLVCADASATGVDVICNSTVNVVCFRI